MGEYHIPVALGILFGFIARTILLRTDFRQYPSYPQGRIIHLSLGFIASFIGAVAIPSFLESDWTAVTFLGLAATQFREIRKMERETLNEIDSMELVRRGTPFIEGMAQAFEGRNYLVMFSSLTTTFFTSVLNVWIGIIIGIVMLIIVKVNMNGKNLLDMAEIRKSKITFDGPNLFINNILISNIGLKKTRKIIVEKAVGVIIVPNDANSKVTLSYLGQQQAMLHHVSNVLGVYRDSGEPDLVPLAKRDKDDGRIALLLLPQVNDFNRIKGVLKHVPILDSAMRLPTKAFKKGL